jgi:hypothetical protein
VHDTPADTPAHFCRTCPPPKQGSRLRPADPGYKTCTACYDACRATLLDVRDRYQQLDSTPGASGADGGRGAPGFGSRPPATLHVIAMRDWRSKPCEVSHDAVAYVYDPATGEAIDKREVWYGADGRPHSEQERPVRSVPGTLASLAHLVAEERDIRPPATRDVAELVRWLDGQMDWITRQELVADFYRDLRDLQAQLRPVTGDRRARIGTCPNTVDGESEHPRECGAPLHAPTRGDSISCGSCGRVWHRPEWEHLGKMLQAGAA